MRLNISRSSSSYKNSSLFVRVGIACIVDVEKSSGDVVDGVREFKEHHSSIDGIVWKRVPEILQNQHDAKFL